MLIMPCRASASRCRVQVTSNVRPAKNRLSMFALKARAPVPTCVNAPSHRSGRVCVQNEVPSCRLRQKRCARNLGQASGDLFSKESDLRGAASSSLQSSQQSTSMACRGTRKKTSGQRSKALSHRPHVHGILQPSVRGIGMQPVARRPNHSVNLTRNSGPHWPSDARYAHNASLVQRGPLPRAGYLKR
jgi:hypothetical protein